MYFFTAVSPTRLVVYQRDFDREVCKRCCLTEKTVLSNNDNYSINQALSKQGRLNLTNAINTLSYLAEWKTVYSKEKEQYFRFKLNFITLTLPAHQNCTDKELIKNVFSKFMEAWAKRSAKLLYVWKAEVQDNGNLHFHVTSNTYIHYAELRERWNKACAKSGIRHKQLRLEANSTDVHATKNIKNLAAYLTAYMTKKDLYKKPLKRYFKIYGKRLRVLEDSSFKLPKKYFENIKRKVECAKWGASKVLLSGKITVCLDNSPAGRELDSYFLKRPPDWKDDYAALYKVNPDLLKRLPETNKLFKKHINEKFVENRHSEKVVYQIK